MIAEKFLTKEAKLAIIGLGYVGLPIALAFAKKINVIGFDINDERLELMRNHIDPSGELTSEDFEHSSIHFTSSLEELKEATFFIVTVPTPIDSFNAPDLKPLLSATKSIGQVLKKGDYVVYESTVYPGCTEEDCVPLLEQLSELTLVKDFKVGYSPERINPGDKEHTITKITKVVSGCDNESLNEIANVYKIIVEAGIHKAPSIKVAEAAKIIENTQRDVNIALMNELSLICDKLSINTLDVLEAASTKWNFLKFTPGLVGGHCIGVDPYYLTYKAKKLGVNPEVILSGRHINDAMPSYIAKRIVKHLSTINKPLNESKVLVMGVTFKENVEDIRNSKVVDMINELKDFDLEVECIDPHAHADAFFEEYGLTLTEHAIPKYDVVILAVAHNAYVGMDEACFKGLLNENGLLFDIKGLYRNKKVNVQYLTL